MSPHRLTPAPRPLLPRLLCVLAVALGGTALAAHRAGEAPGAARDVTTVLGPASCAECHVEEFETWQASTHQTGSKLLTRNKEAQAIARALGIRRLKNDARCTSCHYTVTGDEAKTKAVAGVSCESCHGGARDWLDPHADFGGADATAASETDEHRAQRVKSCDEAGMVRPRETHALVEQCFVCHAITDEELIEAGHPTGEGFEMVAWSQGEVRHNFVRSQGKTNAVTTVAERGEFFVIGQMLELSFALRALQTAQEGGTLATSSVARAEKAIATLEGVQELLGAKEIMVVLDAAGKLELTAGVDAGAVLAEIANCATMFQESDALPRLGELEPLLPKEDAFVGEPAR